MDLRSEIRIGLQSEGSERATELADKIRALTAAIDQLKATSAGGGADLGKLDAALQKTRASQAAATQGVYDFGDSFEVLGLAEEQEAARLAEVNRVAKLYAQHLAETAEAQRRATQSVEAYIAEQVRLNAAHVTATTSAKASAESMHIMGMSAGQSRGFVQQFGYGIGDLAQTSGDLGQKLNSVTNNIQFMLAGLGTWGVAIGLATTLGVSLYRNLDEIGRWFEDKSPFPKGADDVHSLERALEAAKKITKDLGEYTSLTADELKKYNVALGDRVRLEKEVSEEKERQKRLEKLDKLESPEQKKFDDEQAKILEREMAGGAYEGANRDAMIAALTEAFRRGAEAKVEKQMDVVDALAVNRATATPHELAELEKARQELKRLKFLASESAQAEDANRAAAKDLLAKAVDRGDSETIETIAKQQKAFPEAFTDRQKKVVEEIGPAGQERQAREKQGGIDRLAREKAQKEWDAKEKHDEKEILARAKREVDARWSARDRAASEEEHAEQTAEQAAKTRAGRVAASASRPMEDKLTLAAERRAAKGQSADKIAAALVPQVEAVLRRQNGGDDSGAAAQIIVGKVLAKLAGVRAGIGGTEQEAAGEHLAGIVAAEAEKVKRRGDKASKAGVARAHAEFKSYTDVVHEMHLRQLAAQEQMHGVLGPATERLQMLMTQQQMMNQEMSRIANDGGFQNFNPIGG